MKIDDNHYEELAEWIINRTYQEQPIVYPSTISEIIILLSRVRNESVPKCVFCSPIHHANDHVNGKIYCAVCNNIIGDIPEPERETIIVGDDV